MVMFRAGPNVAAMKVHHSCLGPELTLDARPQHRRTMSNGRNPFVGIHSKTSHARDPVSKGRRSLSRPSSPVQTIDGNDQQPIWSVMATQQTTARGRHTSAHSLLRINRYLDNRVPSARYVANPVTAKALSPKLKPSSRPNTSHGRESTVKQRRIQWQPHHTQVTAASPAGSMAVRGVSSGRFTKSFTDGEGVTTHAGHEEPKPSSVENMPPDAHQNGTNGLRTEGTAVTSFFDRGLIV